jgi:hypothetical protein
MNSMTQTPSRDQRDVVTREISDWYRRILAIIGLMSWVAGGVVAFRNTNGAGAAAFIVAGVVCVVLALVGRWPSQISLSGSALSWDDVKETVNSQIEVAEKSGEPNDVLKELKVLRDRLDVLQRTGSVPEHPAEAYDKSVEAALRRLLPDFEIVRQPGRSRSIADFVVRNQRDQLFVETKWRADTTQPFGGSTLPRLAQNLPPEAKLLIVVNTHNWRPSATNYVEDALGERGRIVAWRDVRDDAALAEAVTSLLRVGKR